MLSGLFDRAPWPWVLIFALGALTQSVVFLPGVSPAQFWVGLGMAACLVIAAARAPLGLLLLLVGYVPALMVVRPVLSWGQRPDLAVVFFVPVLLGLAFCLQALPAKAGLALWTAVFAYSLWGLHYGNLLAAVLAVLPLGVPLLYGVMVWSARRRLARSVLHSEMERMRQREEIAEVLHDSLSHSLVHQAVIARYAATLTTDPKLTELLGQILQNARGALGQLRNLTLELQNSPDIQAVSAVSATPDSTDTGEQPFAQWVDSLRRFLAHSGGDVDFVVSGDLSVLEEKTGQVVMQICQEIATNIVKHAGVGRSVFTLSCQRAKLRIYSSNPLVIATTTDSQPRFPSTGLGLHGICKAADSVGGQCHYGSDDGNWNITVTLPLSNSATI